MKMLHVSVADWLAQVAFQLDAPSGPACCSQAEHRSVSMPRKLVRGRLAFQNSRYPPVLVLLGRLLASFFRGTYTHGSRPSLCHVNDLLCAAT